jgi:hypothetical protein
MTISYGSVAGVRSISGLPDTSTISDADITTFLDYAASEIESSTDQKFTSTTTYTEFYPMYPPKRADGKVPNRLTLKHYPVLSIDSFLLINADGTTYATLDTLTSVEISAGTYNSADYFCDPNTGLIETYTYYFDFVPRRVKITYKAGYASVPGVVTQLANQLAAQMALTQFLGGSWQKANSYKVPEQEYDKGDIKGKAQAALDATRTKIDFLYGMLGNKWKSQIAAVSGGFF